MSRIGRLPIAIPAKVEVAVDGNVVSVKGPLGESQQKIASKYITVKVENGHVIVERNAEINEARAAHGLYRQLIANMVNGALTPFSKTLIIAGVGYRAAVQGNKLVLNIGYSHPVEFELPSGVKAEAKEGDDKDKKTLQVVITGMSKEAVGQFAAKVKAARPVEPYHGYGIHYSDEVVIRKEGKTSGKK